MRAALPSLLLCACATTASPLPRRIVDLSRPIAPGKANRIELEVTEHPSYLAMASVTLFNHGGTHVDPPNHVIRGAPAVDALPLETFMGRARVLDLRGKPRDQALGRADFEGRGIAAGDVVIAFVGCPDGPPSRCPYLGADAAEYLASIPIKAFATDNWTIANVGLFAHFWELNAKNEDRPGSEFVPEHLTLLGHGIANFEGLTNLEALLAEKNIVFVGFPIRIQDGNGAPVRAAALIY